MSAPAGREGDVLRCLLVQAGEVLCALPVARVRRVARALRVSPVPGCSAALSGIAEFAGEPIVVFDLARLIDAPAGANPDYPVTVVVDAGEAHELVGLSADAALRFADLPLAAAVSNADSVAAAEVVLDGSPVRLIDLTRLGAER